MPHRALRSAMFILCSLLVLQACASDRSPPAPPKATAAATAPADPLAAALGHAEAPRRIVRDAELSVEVTEVAAAHAKVVRIVERGGGYVGSSQTTGAVDARSRGEDLGLRVPADRFTEVLGKIRNLGNVTAEHVTGHDVTDEFVDLDARVAATRAIEMQYLAMLQKATTVTEMLAVQRELGNVRTDLERMEGKRRLLADQTALSSIRVHLIVMQPLVTASWRALEADAVQAGASGVNVSATLVSVILRALSVLVPVAVLVGLPMYLGLKALMRGPRRAPR